MTDPARELDRSKEFASPSMWRSVWRRFKRHRLGVAGGVVVFVLMTLAALAEFISPYSYTKQYRSFAYAPPTRVHFFSEEGFSWRPFVYGIKRTYDAERFTWVYEEDRSQRFPLRFFVRVREAPYRFWGLFSTDVHLFGTGEPPDSPGQIFLFGTDNLGRDLFSRTLVGGRISLLIGPLVIIISFALGILLGGLSGYYGGWPDNLIQRATEVTMALPRLALLLAFATIIPPKAPPMTRFWAIVAVLAVVSWAPLARVIRGQFLALREEEFSLAARALGASDLRVILRHILPNTMSYLVVSATLTVPNVIILESALSFFNYGIQEPLVSWGVLLQKAQSVFEIEFHPWYLIPGFFIVATVLAFNFMGDALRDAVDPFSVVGETE